MAPVGSSLPYSIKHPRGYNTDDYEKTYILLEPVALLLKLVTDRSSIDRRCLRKNVINE